MKQDMSTTYGIKKQVTRLMAGSSHTLSLLMSMLRVSLEAAWSMARSSLEIATPHSDQRSENGEAAVCGDKTIRVCII